MTDAAVMIFVFDPIARSEIPPAWLMDAFRLTLSGKLIFGRFFSWKDLAAYGLAIAVTALLDNALFRPRLARHD